MERIVALNQSQTEPTIDVDTTFEKVLNEVMLTGIFLYQFRNEWKFSSSFVIFFLGNKSIFTCITSQTKRSI